jgi:hypothetical protein
MKKWTVVAIMALMALIGCRKQHIYHTFYGDIDIDTMEIALFDLKDSLPCYLVHSSDLDSVEKVPGVWGYIYGPLFYYYCPQKDIYYYTFPDNQGNYIFRVYNPVTKESYNPVEK